MGSEEPNNYYSPPALPQGEPYRNMQQSAGNQQTAELPTLSVGAKIGNLCLGFFLSWVGLLISWGINKGKAVKYMRWPIIGAVSSFVIIIAVTLGVIIFAVSHADQTASVEKPVVITAPQEEKGKETEEPGETGESITPATPVTPTAPSVVLKDAEIPITGDYLTDIFGLMFYCIDQDDVWISYANQDRFSDVMDCISEIDKALDNFVAYYSYADLSTEEYEVYLIAVDMQAIYGNIYKAYATGNYDDAIPELSKLTEKEKAFLNSDYEKMVEALA